VALEEPHAARLAEHGGVPGLVAAGIRELWEEAGLILGAPGPFTDPPPGWEGFAATGHRPSAAGMAFVFRAVTPPGRTRRFDARFLLVGADRLACDPDDFSAAQDELAALQWIPLAEARSFDLPFVTEIVLAEVEAIARGEPQDGVPFLRNDDEATLFLRLHGRPQDR
jgi:8-oxo-dGTP pyrophosphatase MutT (NUDIX family)